MKANLKQCTSSLVPVEVYSVTSSLDTRQLSLLSGTHTPAKSYDSEPKMDGSQACTCGKGTFDCSIHPSMPESWTAYMQDSLASILAIPENKRVLELIHEVDCTEKLSGLLGFYDQSSSIWKTSQQSLLKESEQLLETWPRSGMTVNGFVYELPIAVHRMNAIDGGFLPTPTAHDAKKGNYPSEHNRNTPGIAVILGGKPAPTFQEWQMGWPINHTALRLSEMDKSHCKQQSPGNSSEELE